MGSVSLKLGDGTARFRRSTLCSSALHLIMLASVLTTNLFALYAFTSPHPQPHPLPLPLLHLPPKNLSLISDHISLILREIDSSERKLHQISRDLAGYDSLDPASPHLPPELKSFLVRHPLPLGRDARSGITHLVSSVSHNCSPSIISNFMSYTPGLICPSATTSMSTVNSLLSKGCDPLPRRRCLTRRPKPPSPLLPFPASLWIPSAPADPQTWIKSRGKNDFLISDVLSLGSAIRIGLDVAGSAGTFAARMAEHNVTIVTTTADASADLIATRGLIPLLMTPVQRLPFQDSVFDLVHVSKALDEVGVPGHPEAMEFLLFDVDRVLRTGGLLWIDNYLCVDDERKRTLTKLVERFGYKKKKWVVGEKAGGGKAQLYLSAVLQKPARG